VMIVVVLTSLSGCLGFGEDETASGFSLKKFSTFQVEVPKDWRNIDKKEFSSIVPEETVAVFASSARDGFIKNLNILKENINTEASSNSYAKANILIGGKSLIDYAKIEEEHINIGGEDTVLHVFRARNSSTDKLLNFIQTYLTRGKIGYTITCVLPENASDEEIPVCKKAVSSFNFL